MTKINSNNDKLDKFMKSIGVELTGYQRQMLIMAINSKNLYLQVGRQK